MNTCIECGDDYPYDPSNPLGASSVHCPRCRKRQSKLNKKIILFNIAGNGKIQCRSCGYSRSVNAIVLINGVNFLNENPNEEEKKLQAKQQFLLCLCCDAQVKAGEVDFRVTNSKVSPICVEFYERKVVVCVEKRRMEAAVNYSSDVIQTELSSDGDSAKRISRKTPRIDSGPTIDVPPM